MDTSDIKGLDYDMPEDIVHGLDVESKEDVIYITHSSVGMQPINIPVSWANKSEFLQNVIALDSTIVNNTNPEAIITIKDEFCTPGAFKFMMWYIEEHIKLNIVEMPAPKQPLEKTLEDTFGSDYSIFKVLVSEKPVKEQSLQELDNKMKELGDIINFTNYMGMNTLRDKVCAVNGDLLRNLTKSQINDLIRMNMNKMRK